MTSDDLQAPMEISPWLSVSTEQPTLPSPTGPKSGSSIASLAQRGLQAHKLTAINEVSDEDTLQSRRGSSLRKLQRLEAVEVETPASTKVIVEAGESAPLCRSEFEEDPMETTPLTSQKEDVDSDKHEISRGSRQMEPPTTLNLRHKASPANK
ncbi:hypothetical protein OESDEN_13564 [Oesophagostomum dentatum]|uniref:Uncharacterized protein n=1 Tax=Oesophagostomum dentatum TaxID=61180 RepID=A0A0B1SS39_OESDE|nr:hypothetical protein OESDEN_13564 [Oesophagostomum dentatum]